MYDIVFSILIKAYDRRMIYSILSVVNITNVSIQYILLEERIEKYVNILKKKEELLIHDMPLCYHA